MTLYGNSLIGNIPRNPTIVCEEGTKPTKKAKESKKAKELKENIKKEKDKILKQQEAEKLLYLGGCLGKCKEVDDLKKLFDKMELDSSKIQFIENKLEILLMKAKVLDKMCIKLSKQKNPSDESELGYFDNLFLIMREILIIHEHECQLSQKEQKNVSKILANMGFSELILRNNLPESECGHMYANNNWLRYQLTHLGSQLLKAKMGEFDPDVGFSPDPWQLELINAIRKNQSAVIVAPTSSGKTFASYYCMKRVLQKSRDGIVVYVSPTKALVNQVAATMYAQFHNIQLQPGVSIVGIFTRDYKTSGTTSRILVTIPQCLEILLMSPRRYSWSKNIKYVIFDEVHCLAGQAGGITWERCLLLIRCPFLALSATIGNPKDFHKWLVDAEKFKEQQDIKNAIKRTYDSKVHLVIYSERYSDLIKHTYLKKTGLGHYHPYHTLDMQILRLQGGVPANILLSPKETLQLYDVIHQHCGQYLPEEMHLEKYINSVCKNG